MNCDNNQYYYRCTTKMQLIYFIHILLGHLKYSQSFNALMCRLGVLLLIYHHRVLSRSALSSFHELNKFNYNSLIKNNCFLLKGCILVIYAYWEFKKFRPWVSFSFEVNWTRQKAIIRIVWWGFLRVKSSSRYHHGHFVQTHPPGLF